MTRATTRAAIAALKRDTEAIRNEGDGVWQTTIVVRENVPRLGALALAGDPDARRTLDIIEPMVHRISNDRTSNPILCLTCEAAFGRYALPAAFVLTHAYHPTPTLALCHGICAGCCRKWNDTELPTAVLDAIRRLLVSDLRWLPPIAPSTTA